jgi:hypothetical protein
MRVATVCAAIALLAGCSDPVGVTPEASMNSVIFTATPAVLDAGGDVITAAVMLENTMDVTRHLTWGGCGFELRLYRDLSDQGSQARLLPLTACDDILHMLTMQPNQTHTIVATLHLSSLRPEDLEPGRWWVVVAVDAGIDGEDAKFLVSAGSVILN